MQPLLCVGTLIVDGLGLGVDSQGIQHPNRPANSCRLTMRERLLLLCKLGSGASSAVYKALDVQDMRIVALKTIKVSEKLVKSI
jgi:hypothetical protein